MALYRVNISGGSIPAVIVNAENVSQAFQYASDLASGRPTSATFATYEDVNSVPLASSVNRGDTRPAIQADPNFVAMVGGFGTPPAGTVQQEPVAGSMPGPQITGSLVPPPPPPPPVNLGPAANEQAGLFGPGPLPTGGGGTLPAPGGIMDAIRSGGLLAPGASGAGASGSASLGGGAIAGPMGGSPLPASASGFDKLGGLDVVDPRASFIRGLAGAGLPSQPTSILGRHLLAQQPEFENVFRFGSATQGLTPGAPAFGDLETFTRNRSATNVRALAAQLLAQLSNTQIPETPETDPQKFAASLQNPEAGQAKDLLQLALSAIASRVSPLALDLLNIPSGEQLRSEYLARGGGDSPGTFLDYMRRRLPLQSALGG